MLCLGLGVLIVSGCAMFERLFGPSAPAAPASAPPPRQAPSPSAPASPAPSTPATPAPTPTPPVSPPARPPAPARPGPQPATPAPPAAPPPAPVLTPQVGKADEDRLRKDSEARITRVEQLLATLDQRRLGTEDRETQDTIKDFIAKAKDALASQDLLRASSLSEKAQVLADDLASRLK